MIFRIFAVLILLAVAVASVWMGGQQHEPAATTTVQNATGELGYSARKAELVETGPDGIPMYTILADTIRQHPGDSVEFDQVQMSFRDQGGQTWKARADQGEMGQDTGKVALSGNVHVNGLLSGSNQNADLATDKLYVDTHADIISTDQDVTLNWAGRQLKSRGLVETLQERRLLLESNVHGTFLP
jgi:LPS export ABC transporter protein LptC